MDSSIKKTSDSGAYTENGAYTLKIKARNVSSRRESIANLNIVVSGGIEGLWHSSFLDITFDEPSGIDVHGTFLPGQNGDITGFFTGNGLTLSGYWVETISAEKCETQRLDSTGTPSFHWGRLEFVFDENFTQFCGFWNRCTGTPDTMVWNGWAPGFVPPDCP